MSIYIGNNELNNVYVGTSQVSEVYVGNTLVWSSSSLMTLQQLIDLGDGLLTPRMPTAQTQNGGVPHTPANVVSELNNHAGDYYTKFSNEGLLANDWGGSDYRFNNVLFGLLEMGEYYVLYYNNGTRTYFMND